MRWGAVSGATSYRCDIYTDSTLVKTGSVVTGTSTVWQGLAGNTTYTFRVVAINGAGESSYSTISATTFATNFNLGLSASIVVNNLINIQWNRVTNEPLDKFDAYYSIGSPDNFQLLKYNTLITSYSFNGSPNTTYYFYIKYRSWRDGYGNYEHEGHSEIVYITTGAAVFSTATGKCWAKAMPSLQRQRKMQPL